MNIPEPSKKEISGWQWLRFGINEVYYQHIKPLLPKINITFKKVELNDKQLWIRFNGKDLRTQQDRFDFIKWEQSPIITIRLFGRNTHIGKGKVPKILIGDNNE